MTESGGSASSPDRIALFKAAITLALGLMVAVLIRLHTPYLNGPPFFPWAWRVVPGVDIYPLMAVALMPLFAALWMYARWRRVALALPVVMLACLLVKFAAVLPLTDPPTLEMIRVAVEDRDTTSYYTDAAALRSQHSSVREWLQLYPQYMPNLSLHSKTKAPGPILYWTAMIARWGVGPAAALRGGIILGVLAIGSIVAAYLLIRSLTGSRDAAFYGACFMAVTPGFVLFLPMFDPIYPMLSCALVGFWGKALQGDDWRWSAALGVTVMLVCLISFHVLVVGAFMALYPLVMLEGPMRKRLIIAVKHAAIALSIGAALVLALRPAIGYDAFATFASAWRNQRALLAQHAETRPYPDTILFDLTDFALGSGWVSVPLVIFFFISRRAAQQPRLRRLAILCLAQLLIVAVTGLLQSETARVWNFMLPLLMIPVGLELVAWPGWARVCAYAALSIVTAAVAQNVMFIY